MSGLPSSRRCRCPEPFRAGWSGRALSGMETMTGCGRSVSGEMPRCVCGDEVAVPHGECVTLLSPAQRENFSAGRPVGDVDAGGSLPAVAASGERAAAVAPSWLKTVRWRNDFTWGSMVPPEGTAGVRVDPTPPERLTLADGSTIEHAVGAVAFNYYDRAVATITATSTRCEPDTSGLLPRGEAWWVDTTAGYLDGSRMVSLATARQRGWLEDASVGS